MAFRITTKAFQPNGSIPMNFTAEGQNKSPLLSWEDPPEGTQSYALIMDDPDAPGRIFTHWLIYDIPKELTHLDPELPPDSELTGNIRQGKNDAGGCGYYGPKPPEGEKHRYQFKLYALSIPPGLRPEMTRDELLSRIRPVTLAETQITGLYKSLRKKPKVA